MAVMGTAGAPEGTRDQPRQKPRLFISTTCPELGGRGRGQS